MSLSSGRPFWVSGSCREAPECSGGTPGCPGVIGRPSQMYGSGLDALQSFWEWSKDTHGCPGMVERPSWITGIGREALPDVRE